MQLLKSMLRAKLVRNVILSILRLPFSAATISALSATKSVEKRYRAVSTSARLSVIWASAIHAIRRQPLNAGKFDPFKFKVP